MSWAGRVARADRKTEHRMSLSTRQLYHIGSPYRPEYSATAAVRRDTIKGAFCVTGLTSRELHW